MDESPFGSLCDSVKAGCELLEAKGTQPGDWGPPRGVGSPEGEPRQKWEELRGEEWETQAGDAI
jgi:hypothetical protein